MQGNNCNIHAGTVRQTPHPRRSLGMTFYTSADPPLAAARRARPDDGRADKTPQFWERFVGKFPELLRWVPMLLATFAQPLDVQSWKPFADQISGIGVQISGITVLISGFSGSLVS